jgi:predicted RNase H-like HicB family nuclease
MKKIDYVVWKEDKYYVSKCLNVEVSSFGESKSEAIENLKEAVELYLEGEDNVLSEIDDVLLGKEEINA